MKTNNPSRREFVKKTSLAAGSIMAMPFASEANFFNSSADDTIKVALIGCGNRGSGAIAQALKTKQNVKLVAMADAFKDRLDGSLKDLREELNESLGESVAKKKIDVKEENKFVGFDAYKKAIPLADVVILTTPPGFNARHRSHHNHIPSAREKRR
jgi:predicted homoserine dehydrogenase-like protein